jgi:putative PIN family toxin of toxin-antitoxin system
MKIVLDTNVLVSALLKADGIPARILRAVWDGQLELLISAPLLEELAAVLEYPKIRKRLVAEAVDTRLFLELLPFYTSAVTIGETAVPRPRDADDRVVLATLVAGGADWLITGDGDLIELSKQFPILTPGAFVERFLE